MPRPTKRAKPSAESDNVESSSSAVARPISQEQKGLVALPSELLLEIVSNFPEISLEHILDSLQTLPVEYRVRFAALRALSQTCKELRSVVLPLAWERLEACTTAGHPTQFFKEVGSSLERKCKGLLASKHLLPHVRIVTVSLTKYQMNTILPLFAQCLEALPNLHTIQICHVNSQLTTPLKNAFSGKTYPNVRTMILPPAAHEILRRCPGLENVTANEYEGGSFVDGSKIAGAVVATKCTKLKTLRRVNPNQAMVKRIAKIAPDLKVIQVFAGLHTVLPEDFIKELTAFKNLESIEIRFTPDLFENQHGLKYKQGQLTGDAQTVLKSSKTTSEKKIVLMFTRWEGEEQVDRGHSFDQGHIREYKRETVVVN